MIYNGEEIPDELGFDKEEYERYVARHSKSAVHNEKICPEKDFWEFVSNAYDNLDSDGKAVLSIVDEVCANV